LLRTLTTALIVASGVGAALPGAAPATAPTGIENGWRPLEFADPVVGKNFYLFDAVGRTPAVREQLQQQPILAEITRERVTALEHAAAACGADAGCHAAAFKWSEDEIARAERGLRAVSSDNGVARLIARDLRPSGMFEPEEELLNADLLAGAWRDAAFALNRIVDVYALGTPPLYPAIDT